MVKFEQENKSCNKSLRISSLRREDLHHFKEWQLDISNMLLHIDTVESKN